MEATAEVDSISNKATVHLKVACTLQMEKPFR